MNIRPLCKEGSTMLKAKTGYSTAADGTAAGREAADMIRQDLKAPNMAFVYSGVQYDQKALMSSISRELPNVPLIGNTSFTGVITPDGFKGGENSFVGIMALEDPDMVVGVAGAPKMAMPVPQAGPWPKRHSRTQAKRQHLTISTCLLLRAKKRLISKAYPT